MMVKVWDNNLKYAVKQLTRKLLKDGSFATLKRRNQFPKRSELLRAKRRAVAAARRKAIKRAQKNTVRR